MIIIVTILIAYTRWVQVVHGKNSTLYTSILGHCNIITSSNKITYISYLIKEANTRKASIDTGKITTTPDHQPKSKFDIQAIRETEREYHQSQIALEGLRENKRRRSTSIRAQRAQGSLRRRVIDSFKYKYQSTSKAIRWITINIIIQYLKYHIYIYIYMSNFFVNIIVCVRTILIK